MLPRSSTLLGLFTVGLALSAAFSPTVLRQLGKLGWKQAQQTETVLPKAVEQQIKQVTHGLLNPTLQVSTYISQPGLVGLRLAALEPSMVGSVLQYGAFAITGFLSANLAQGFQEAWVRWEESCIRANLVGRLKTAFETSIQQKQQIDDDHRVYAHNKLSALLVKHGLNPVDYLPQSPAVSSENPQLTRDFLYMPQARTVESLQSPRFDKDFNNTLRFGMTHQQQSQNVPVWIRPALKAGAVVSGAFTGFLARWGSNRWFEKQQTKAVLQNLPAFTEYLNPNNLEGLVIRTLRELKEPAQQGVKTAQWQWLLGLTSLSALLGLGKLLVSGIREINVTRLNAETEFNYEQYKWTQLDTMYHQSAERVQLDSALDQLEQGLSQQPGSLTNQPTELKQRIETLLGNIGYWSPPPYYPVTPAVQLVEARS